MGSDPRLPHPAPTGGRTPERRGADLRAARIGPRLRALGLTVLLILATVGIGWLIWSVVEWRRGRTPGYQLVGLRIVRRSDGRQAGTLRCALRTLCCAILILPTIVVCCLLAVTFVMGASPPSGLLSRPRAAPWDRLSGTEVVEEHRRGHGFVLGGDWPADASMDGRGANAGFGFGARQN